jgi:hypothetical protein
MAGEEPRSFTDPVTNLTGLRHGNPEELASGLIKGRLPGTTWHLFIHELTHHWCFNTPVGHALSVLYIRPFLELLDRDTFPAESSDEDAGSRYISGLDIVTYDMAMGLLFPILEGMAMFCEFDVTPHLDGEAYSLPLHLTVMFYIGGTGADEDLDTAIGKFLLIRRTSWSMVERKAGLLAYPLSKVDEGYLAAYLMIKQLRLKLAARDERLWNGDVFLRFLHQYIFCDLGLVARLLEPDNGTHDRYQTVANAFNDRVTRLHRMDSPTLKDMVDQVINLATALGVRQYVSWDDNVSQRSAFDNNPSLGVDSELRQSGVDYLLSALEQIRQPAAADQPLQTAAGQALRLMFVQRDVFRILHQPVNFHVHPAGTLSLQYGDLHMTFKLVADISLAEGNYDGTITGCIVPRANTFFIAVAIDGRIIGLSVIGDPPSILENQLMHYRMDGPEVIRSLLLARQLAEQDVRLDGRIAILSDATQKSVASWHEQLAAAHGAPWADAAQRDAALDRLNRSGFGEVIGSTNDLRALATISLLASFLKLEDFVAKCFELFREVHGFEDSYSDVVARIRERGAEFLNDPLLLDFGPFLVSTV